MGSDTGYLREVLGVDLDFAGNPLSSLKVSRTLL
jgi:hypothetical protein